MFVFFKSLLSLVLWTCFCSWAAMVLHGGSHCMSLDLWCCQLAILGSLLFAFGHATMPRPALYSSLIHAKAHLLQGQKYVFPAAAVAERFLRCRIFYKSWVPTYVCVVIM